MNHETHEAHEKILFKEECFAIQGAVFEVYREMGCGFLEAVYQECLEKEFCRQNIPFISQKELNLFYKGEQLRQIYKPDIICYGKIIVELKAAKEIASEHKAQIFNYLKATGLKLGLIVNFGHYPKAQVERIIL
ncbi:MAG: GxxExxY protein [Nitrospinae bacterium]|nr:GxxExxY protein [Nitrospinota bacterium]